jgi:hypothetical protein
MWSVVKTVHVIRYTTYKRRREKGEGGKGVRGGAVPSSGHRYSSLGTPSILVACSLLGDRANVRKIRHDYDIQYNSTNVKLHTSQDGSSAVPESGVSNPARSPPEMTLYLPFPLFALRSANAATSYT